MNNLSAAPARSFSIAMLACVLSGSSVISAYAIPFTRGLSVFTAATEKAKAPIGWDAFCARYSSECNKAKNRAVAPTSLARQDTASDWAGDNNKPIALQEWPLISVWAFGNHESYGSSGVKLAFWDASLEASDWFGPGATGGFAIKEESYASNERPADPSKIELTPENWEAIVVVNSRVNKQIKPVPDAKHFGKVNVWVYPDDGKGDCKAYVLLKQRKLILAGFPREALLITIVWTKENQGHAVLMARTKKGDYILDNLSPKVSLWTETTHDYVKRQSVADPNKWVYIDGYLRKQPAMAAVAMNDSE